MLLARLAAEKQEVSCKTLLKLENNSLKGVWSTIQILRNYYREKNHAWAEGMLREPVEERRHRKRSMAQSSLPQRATVSFLLGHCYYYHYVFKCAKASNSSIWKEVEVPGVCLHLAPRATTVLWKTLTSGLSYFLTQCSPGFGSLHDRTGSAGE